MKKTENQFPACDNCGREIRGKAHTVPLRSGEVQNFHTDAHGCASAGPAKKSKEKSQKATKGGGAATYVNIEYEG